MSARGADEIEACVRAEGSLASGREVVVLLSGGRDSVCLLDLAVRLAGAPAVHALHVNYGLRPGAEEDEALCRELCARLGARFSVRRPRLGEPAAGNLQAWAREQRYAEAARLAPDDALVAAGHTASDQVETVLYRLAASPGRRALLGMAGRGGCDGRVVRPLLAVWREETAAYCTERGLPWREDPSNASPAFARNRVRHGLLPALRSLHPAAEANVLRTVSRLNDEATVLEHALDAALAEAGEPPALPALAALPPALGRLALQRLVDRAAEGQGPAVGHRLGAVLALGAAGGTATLDLGEGLRAVVEYGRLRVTGERRAAAPRASAWLPVPGRARWGAGELRCERGRDLPVADGTLDAATLEAPLEVRAWRPGDRMRPLGLGASKRLQDLFVDRKVARERRGALPVVLSAGTIAWVPGVATGEAFRVRAGTRDRVRLSWTMPVAAQGHAAARPAGSEP